MPTYEYECLECGKHFDVFQSMKDPRLEDCLSEDCDGTMKRLIGTGAGLIFKGSGFYETDYRSDSYKSGAKKDSEASKPGTSDSSKSGSESGKKEGSGTSTSSSSSGKTAASPSSGSSSSSSSGGGGSSS